MKRFAAVMVFLLVMCAGCYGAEQAESEVYVRKEVFSAYLESVNTKMDRILEELRAVKEELKAQGEEIKSLRQDLNNLATAVAVLAQRVDNLEVRMSDLQNNLEVRMSDLRSGLEGRMGALQNYIYLMLVILGIIVALPSVQKFLEWRDSRRPSITLEDVKRLIEESKGNIS